MKQRMADGGSERAGESDWRKLLVETRRALTRLRFEDLEELAGRAEEMLRSARAAKFSRPGALEFRARGGAAMARELRLLDELLRATDRNTAVLRRLLGHAADPTRDADRNIRWAR